MLSAIPKCSALAVCHATEFAALSLTAAAGAVVTSCGRETLIAITTTAAALAAAIHRGTWRNALRVVCRTVIGVSAIGPLLTAV